MENKKIIIIIIIIKHYCLRQILSKKRIIHLVHCTKYARLSLVKRLLVFRKILRVY